MSERRGNLTIVNQLGLHARAASKFVGLAGKFDAEVWIGVGEREVNGKSILGVLMLAAAKGSTVTLRCTGNEADGAYDALAQLIQQGFGET
ncbi:MAG: HPr family phosphocarrier protein [Nannocystaceae bacterium]|nr:HPr family phosphocarrier protein [Nannocystaceae bacterium]